MATARLNGVRLRFEGHAREGLPMILVHGSWDSHEGWSMVIPSLARSFRVIAYDRRGHSASEQPAERGSIHDDAADMVALIDRLDARPAWLTGSSFGATIALRVAVESPSRVAGVVGHEPPALSLARDDANMAPILVTAGSESLPLFPWVLHKIADAVPSARRRVFSEAGHVPHVPHAPHPDAFVQVTREFVRQHA